MAEFTAAELDKWAVLKQKIPPHEFSGPVACPWCETLFWSLVGHQCAEQQAALREYVRRKRQQ